jgi:hypothetical protein
MSELDEEAHVDRFEKLKAETLDLLGSSGECWLSFEDIGCTHEDCDGEIDRDELRVALEELLDEGKIEHQETDDGDEYRWLDPTIESMGAKVKRLEAENAALRARVHELELAVDDARSALL